MSVLNTSSPRWDELPAEILDQITFYVEDAPTVSDLTGYGIAFNYLGQKDLASLRLVNKAIYASASARLFRSLSIGSSVSDCYRFLKQLSHLSTLARSHHAGSVEELSVQLQNLSLETGPLDLVIEELNAVFPACLTGFRRLSVLHICGPDSAPNPWYSYALDLKATEPFRESFADCLGRLFSYAQLPHLMELKLRLACTDDYRRILEHCTQVVFTPCRIPISSTLSHVKHLYLEVADDTGPGARRGHDRLSSRTQERYPNETFARSYFDFVQKAEDLHSLELRCTHLLDLSLANLTSVSSLRCLKLERVKIDSQEMSDLFARNSATLRTMILWDVKLKTGVWETLLAQLCQLPALMLFKMYAIGYDVRGKSGKHYIPEKYITGNKRNTIESRRNEDDVALQRLDQVIEERRRENGLRPQIEYTY